METSLGAKRYSIMGALGVPALGLAILASAVFRHLLGSAGSAVLAMTLLSGAFILVARSGLTGSLRRGTLRAALAASPILVLYLLSWALDPDPQASLNTAQALLVVAFLLGASLVRWTSSAIMLLGRLFAVFVLVQVAWWAAVGAPRLFQGPFGHPNALGQFVMLLAFFPLAVLSLPRRRTLTRVWAFAALLATLLLFVVTGARSTWLAVAVGTGVYVVWPWLARGRYRYFAAFVSVAAGALLVTWLYLIAPQYDWGWRLQEVVRATTGQNLFSGRHLFWDDLGVAIAARPWFGYGAGTAAEVFTGERMSAHNLYLQLLLQVGAVGLVAFLLLLSNVWGQFRAGRGRPLVRLAAAFLLGMLMHQVFEVSLIQNNLATTAPIWLILAIGLNHSWERSA